MLQSLDPNSVQGLAFRGAFAALDRLPGVSIECFDNPVTCQRMWDRLLSGLVFDALEAADKGKFASAADVEQLLAATNSFSWCQRALRCSHLRAELIPPPEWWGTAHSSSPQVPQQ